MNSNPIINNLFAFVVASAVLCKVCSALAASSKVCRATDKVCHASALQLSLLHEFDENELVDTNFKLEKIKNLRDLGSSAPNELAAGKLFRTDCVSNATIHDVNFVLNELKIKTLIDVRSTDEIHHDKAVHNGLIYADFTNFEYNEAEASSFSLVSSSASGAGDKRRYFVPLINEHSVKQAVFWRLPWYIQAQTLLLAPFAKFSSTVSRVLRAPVMAYLNQGGLSLLNELILELAGPRLVAVLRLLSNPAYHPVAYYCTAGKDRTGLLSLLLLDLLDVPYEAIARDYSQSRRVYATLDDQQAVVATLQRMDMDAKVFLGAPVKTVVDTFAYLQQKYGSAEQYLASHGFTPEMKQQLRDNLLLVLPPSPSEQ